MTCTRCHLDKPMSEFYPGVYTCTTKWCAECHRLASREWYRKNRATAAAKVKTYQKNNRESIRVKAKEKWHTRFEERLEKTYGLTLDQYHSLQEKQDFSCALCDTVTALVVDHDHVTQRVRGLLCHTCNSGLGLLKDSRAVLERAAQYVL